MQHYTMSEEIKQAIRDKYPVPEGQLSNAILHDVQVYIPNLDEIINDTIKTLPLLGIYGEVLPEEVPPRMSIADEITQTTQDTYLVQDIMDFVIETFPLADVQGQFIKLAQEYKELQQSSDEEIPEELADVIFVAIGIAALADINIAKVLRDKLNKNKARKWQHIGQGVYQHVKE